MYQLTDSEQYVSVGWDHLTPLTCWLTLGADDPRASKDIKTDTKALLNWVQGTSLKPSSPQDDDDPLSNLPTAETVQDLFLRAEVLKAVHVFCDAATTASKLKGSAAAKHMQPNLITQTRAAAVQSFQSIRDFALEWKKRMREAGTDMVTGLLAMDDTGEDVRELMGEAWSKEETIQDIVESAVDAIDGLTKVRLV
jgi:hypothetical protein